MTKNNDIFIAKIGTIYDPVYITFTQNTTNIAPEEYALISAKNLQFHE